MREPKQERAPESQDALPVSLLRVGRGRVTGCDLSCLSCLRLPFSQDPFYRLRPPPSREAATLSLELAAMTYHLELDEWVSAGWTDFSIQIDNTLRSGVTSGESKSGEQMLTLMNRWKLYRAKSALRERNPLAQIAGAFRQREQSDTIKAVTMLHKVADGSYVVAIGFMGTGSRFYDWFSNFRFTTEEGFHKGFAQLVEYFEQSAERILFPSTAAELGLERLTLADIITEMKSAQSRFFLWMAGHSQGAAVMQVFCHNLLSDWGVLPQNVIGYGFASPTVATGRLLYDPARYPLYHILNSDDVVPRMGALLHLGLCLQYQANTPFRQTSYGWSNDDSAIAVREALTPFALHMTDMLSVMEHCVVFCYCVLEEKGEESLSTLIDKKWTVSPIEKALTYAGDKVQDIMRAIARYAESGYVSLAGHGMDEQRLTMLKESMRPTVKRFTLRQLMNGLHALSVPPHQIMREHYKVVGAYSYITKRGLHTLKPFIWMNRRQTLPERCFAPSIPWYEDEPPTTANTLHTLGIHRPARPIARTPKGVRGMGISALRSRKAQK